MANRRMRFLSMRGELYLSDNESRQTSVSLFFSKLLYLVAVLDLVDENFCRLKAWYEMLIDHDGSVARNIACNFLLSFFIDEASKATNIYIMSA